MTVLALTSDEFALLQGLADSESQETCATGYVARAGSHAGIERYVVRDFKVVPTNAYAARGPFSAALTPKYCLELANRARAGGYGVLLAHTHLQQSGMPTFSSVDDTGELPLQRYFDRRAAGKNFALVVNATGAQCRLLGSGEYANVQLVGKNVSHAFQRLSGREWFAFHDRQVRAFGVEGQCVLTQLRVGIVGLGGTGTIVAQELAYLGIQDYLLIDIDHIEQSNLNRLVGASHADIGRSKVDIAQRAIRFVNPNSRVNTVLGNVSLDSVARKLIDVDFIFLCTDSHSSRAVVNQLAYQYLIPCIDMGLGIHARDGEVTHIAGRVQMLAPGLPCLVCTNITDANEVRREMMNEEERQRDPYFAGPGVPQPAVVSLNASISSLAVTMFIAAVTPMPSQPRMLIYDAIRGTVRPTVMTPQDGCIVCSSSGALARGDTWTLPTRHDSEQR